MIKLFSSISIIFLIQKCFTQEMLSNPRCNHYPERGSCEQSFEIKWYYDRFDHRCRRFHYGGCEGNENRFDTLIECEQSCHFDPQIDEISSRRCFQPHDPGTCWGNFERWYFDSSLKRCVCSWWSGCGGNSNRFYSYPHCMQICGEHAIENIPNNSAPDDTVYESPMQRLSEPHQIPSPLLTKPATQILARPRDTQPLGGGILYPSHVSTPQHPPIYDDPDLFKIHPVFDEDDDNEDDDKYDDRDIEEFETSAYRNPRTLSNPSNPRSSEVQEWSAKTETRFFPNLGLRNRTFTNTGKPKFNNLTSSQSVPPTLAPIPVTTFAPTQEPLKTENQIAASKPVVTGSSPSPSTESETENGMLLNLRPPAEFLSKNKKRNVVEAEVVETNFRTTRQSRRLSSGTSSNSQPKNFEEFETDFKKESPTTKKQNYEKYDTPHLKPNSPHSSPPQLGYAQAVSRNNPRTRYHEEAETQFLRHSYINPPVFPGYPILKAVNSDGYRVPQPVPQGLINQLIAQHLALRERLGQTQKVPVIQVERTSNVKHSVEVRETPFRRFAPSSGTPTPAPTTSENGRTLTYAEKRRRWKEEMKKKLKKQKIPPRQIVRPIITGEKNKYYVTYSPYYRLYQVSRHPPKGLNFSDSTTAPRTGSVTTTSAPLELISPEPPKTAPRPSTPAPSTSATTSTTTTTTTTTSAPKVVSLKVEPVPISSGSTNSNKMQIRVAAIKPTSEAKGKQLLYMDDEDEEWRVEEEDYYVDENGQPTEKLRDRQDSFSTTVSPPQTTTTSDNGLAAIVYPVGYKTGSTSTTTVSSLATTTRKPIEQITPGADYILPPEIPSNKQQQDYTDYGHSEEDLFFWKPEFENRRTRIDPSSQTSATATESFNEELPPSTTNINNEDNDAFEITVHNPNKKKML